MATATTFRGESSTARSDSAVTEFKVPTPPMDRPMKKPAPSATERIGAMATEFAHSASVSVEKGREYVKENPGKGVAIAAAVGAVIGSLLTLRWRRKSE